MIKHKNINKHHCCAKMPEVWFKRKQVTKQYIWHDYFLKVIGFA